MILIPSIDLRNGRCVRLLKGNFDAETRYDLEPHELLQRYRALGASWLHVVDLDGAKDGQLANRSVIVRLASQKALLIQVGGGVRSAAVDRVVDRTIDRALKALNLVLQAGGFGIVVLDLADAPPVALQRLPFTTWLRVQRAVENRDTACVLMASMPVSRSAGGVTPSLAGRTTWDGDTDRSRRVSGGDVQVSVVSPRRRVDGDVRVGTVVREAC